MFFRSRVDASHLRVIGHAVYREHVCRGPSIGRMSVCITAQIVEAGDHLVLQTFVHDVLAPEVSHAVLDPLKIGDSHPARIRQNVRDHENSLLVEDFVGGRGCRTIRAFREHFTPNSVSIL